MQNFAGLIILTISVFLFAFLSDSISRILLRFNTATLNKPIVQAGKKAKVKNKKQLRKTFLLVIVINYIIVV